MRSERKAQDKPSKKSASLRKERGGVFFLLAVCGLLVTGCAVGRPSLPDAPPFNSPAEWLQILTARRQGLRDQKVRARVNLKIDGVRERRAAALLQYRAPNDLKIDIGALGVSVLAARTKNDTLQVYMPRDNNYIEGAPAKVLQAITGVNLGYYDLYDAIFGLPDLSNDDLAYVTRFVPGQRTLIELQYPLWTRRLWIDTRSATLIEEQVSAPDGQRLSSRLLSDYHNENGYILPRHIEIRQGQDLIQIDVMWRKINTGLTDSAFELLVPHDVTRYQVR